MTNEKVTSFAKSLFAGNIPEELVFPYPEPSAQDQEMISMIIENLRRFAAEKIDSVKIEEEKGLSKELLAELGQLGIFGLMVPEEFGGLGLSQYAYGRIFEELGATDASIAVTVGAHSSIGLKGLLLFGNDQQKKKYLPALASGESLAAFALTEPGAGSDAYSIRTRAEKQADGSYVINGNKIWITNGGTANFFTVFAKTEMETSEGKKDRVTAFIVTRDMEGFSHGKEEKKLGIRGSSTTEIFLTNVRVPAENILGEPGMGFKMAMEILNSGRLGLATGSVGGAKKMLELASKHAVQRKQFGKSISEFGMIQEKLGNMAIDIYANECAAYLTCALVDAKVEDYSIESAICKVSASEMLWSVANEATQIAGGASYMQEYPYERMLRDARINMIFEGTNEILRSFIALSGIKGVGDYLKIIGKALNNPIKSLGVLYDYFVVHKISKSVYGDQIRRAHHELKKEASMIEDFVAEFSSSVEKVVMRHKQAIWEKQFTQKRIAEIIMDLYRMVAVVSRTSLLIEKNKDKLPQNELDMARVYCAQASKRISRNFREMDRNQDEVLKEVAAKVAAAGGYPTI